LRCGCVLFNSVRHGIVRRSRMYRIWDNMNKPKRKVLTFLLLFNLILKCLPLIINMQDVYFDDESAEVVISSLRLGDDQGR
jgi:hypothetical protein